MTFNTYHVYGLYRKKVTAEKLGDFDILEKAVNSTGKENHDYFLVIDRRTMEIVRVIFKLEETNSEIKTKYKSLEEARYDYRPITQKENNLLINKWVTDGDFKALIVGLHKEYAYFLNGAALNFLDRVEFISFERLFHTCWFLEGEEGDWASRVIGVKKDLEHER